MEESFPRGGTHTKPKEPAAAKRPHEDDNLFSSFHEDEDTTIKKKKKLGKEEPEQPKPEMRSADKTDAVTLLNFKSLNVGMLFLGCIKDVKDFELVVALPCGLTGFIQATNICEAYTKMLNAQVMSEVPLEGLQPLSSLYSPGMLVRCAISKLDTTSKGCNSIKLSLNPTVINEDLTPSSLRAGMLLSGLVSSVEDHGYLIDLGIAGTQAFLPRQKAQAYLQQANKDQSLYVGQYLNCVIEEVKNKGRVCRLSILQSDVAAAIATDEQQWTLSNLLPGLVVKAQIQKVFPDHITVSLFSSYSGVVDFLNFDSKKASSYQTNQLVKACILWIDRSSKTIRLTLRKSLLQPGAPVPQVTSDWIGSLVENCTVKALYKKAGAIFTLKGEATGFAFKRNLSLPEPGKISDYKEATVHTGRVVGFSPMDEVHLLSFRKEDLEASFLRLEDLHPGQILEGVVAAIEKEGMVVNITKHLTGLVPKLHLADVFLQHPEKKYTPGKKIKCRVLNVYPSAKKLILTCKKTLINSKLPILSTFYEAQPGMVTHGFIAAVKDYGCVVKFYNDVHGLAPSRELSSSFIAAPQEVFYKGQVVKVQVLRCNPETESLIISFKVYEDDEKQTQPEEPKRPVINAPPGHKPGKVVDVKIVSKTEDTLNVLILPGETPAILSKAHLSDFSEHCELLFSCLKEDDVLPGVMVFNNLKDKTILTRKQALIASLKQGCSVKTIADLQIGMIMTGSVKTIMKYGVFVEFLNGLVGLVPIKHISDKFVSSISDHVVVGKTVITKVLDVDERKKRFLLTMKMSECAPDLCPSEHFSRMSQYLSELQFSKDLMKREVESEGDLILSLAPGTKLTLVVEDVTENGPTTFVCSNIPGAKKISAVAHGTKKLSVGQKVKAVVLHVDFLESHVHVSVDKALQKKSKVTLAEGSEHAAVVQHLASEFAVVSLEDSSLLAAVPLSRHFNDALRYESEEFSLGDVISVQLLSADANHHGLLLAVQTGVTTKSKVPRVTVTKPPEKDPALGDLISGTVMCVWPTIVMVSLSNSLPGNIHTSQIIEEVVEGSMPTSSLKPQQSVTCRVIGARDIASLKFQPITPANLKTSVLELSMLPSVLEAPVETLEQNFIKKYSPGEKVTCYVSKYDKESQSLKVEVAPGVYGQVERLLLSSSVKVLNNPEEHFTAGQALTGTVISAEPTQDLLTLSLTDVLEVKEGQVLAGCVTRVKPASGLVISLPGGRSGTASLGQLSDRSEEASVDKFQVGMFVRCSVLSIGKKKISLSLRVKQEEIKAPVSRLHAGQILEVVDVRIVSKTEDALNVSILPGETPAVLSKAHLSDYPEHCELIFRCVKEDDVLPGVMVFNNLKDKTILTRKQALIASLEEGRRVRTIADLQIGMTMTGSVKTLKNYGVFVEFMNGLVGLVPISEISDKFVSSISDHVKVGETVIAKVTNIDEGKKRFLLTMKLCTPDLCPSDLLFRMNQYFTELEFGKDLMKREVAPEDESILSLAPGTKLTLVVEEVTENGPTAFVCRKISGAKKISAAAHGTKKLSVGQKVKAVVLHVDFLESHVHVSVEESLLKKSKVTLAEGSEHSAVVQHLAADFAVVSLEDSSLLAAVPVSRHFNGALRFESEELSRGDAISVKLLSADANHHGLLLAVQTGKEVLRETVMKTPAIGDLITGTVKSVRPTIVMVTLPESKLGNLHASQIREEVALGSVPTFSLKPQQSVTCRVIGARDVKSHKFLPISHPNLKKSILELSILPSVLEAPVENLQQRSLKKYSPGEKVTCYVSKYDKERQSLKVEVAPGVYGQVERLLISSSVKVLKFPEKHFKLGQAILGTVISADPTHKLLTLSFTDVLKLKEGQVLAGCVTHVKPTSGLVISLPCGYTGRAGLCQLSDNYGETSMEKFKVGMFVRCCVLSIMKQKVTLSLRQSRVNPKVAVEVIDEDFSSIDALQEGQLVKGFVSAINDKGVFFRISSSIDGHISFKNVTSYYIKDLEKLKLYIPEGKPQTAKIISIDKEKKQIQLSLLSADTGSPDIVPESAGFELRFNGGKKKRPITDSESDLKKKKRKISKEDEDSGVEFSGQEDNAQKSAMPRLQVSSGFSWDVDLNTLKTSLAAGQESSSDSEEDEEKKLSKAKTTQKSAKKKPQAPLVKESSQSNQQPQSVNEFERLVLSSPNSSANWIQYMDFHLQASELEQARAIAERALQTIYFREEQEKLNVWVAMLKMENTYGTEETLMKVFERAVQHNEPLKVFQHLVDVYIQTEKFKEADELFNTMLKRFRQEKSVYWKYAQYLQKQGQPEASHRLLQRALKSLPEKEHVDVISKFAQLEFRMGDPVRAKALFESTLGSYPKRTDVWSVYIDMMVKHGSQKDVREIFERVIHLSVTAKKIKFFFKRYLEYEKKHGTEKTVQTVKEKALKYVESKGSS